MTHVCIGRSVGEWAIIMMWRGSTVGGRNPARDQLTRAFVSPAEVADCSTSATGSTGMKPRTAFISSGSTTSAMNLYTVQAKREAVQRLRVLDAHTT